MVISDQIKRLLKGLALLYEMAAQSSDPWGEVCRVSRECLLDGGMLKSQVERMSSDGSRLPGRQGQAARCAPEDKTRTLEWMLGGGVWLTEEELSHGKEWFGPSGQPGAPSRGCLLPGRGVWAVPSPGAHSDSWGCKASAAPHNIPGREGIGRNRSERQWSWVSSPARCPLNCAHLAAPSSPALPWPCTLLPG